MRKVIAGAVALLALSACSQAKHAADAESGPGVSGATATDVRFSYRYTVALPDKRIAEVQEQHIQACERLGPARCRIMAMRYRLAAEDEVQATLALRIDPAVARQFGKSGLDAVRGAGGSVIDTSIDGEAISTAGPAPTSAETTQQSAARLAALTPVVFEYHGGAALAQFGGGRISEALATSLASFMMMTRFVLIAIGTVAPWALLGLGLIAAWRSRPIRQLRDVLAGDAATI